MRRALDTLFGAALWLSVACLVAIAVLVMLQVGGRLFDALLVALGRPRYGFNILSLPEIAGFLLAAATFLALAGSLKAGAHVRVTLALAVLPPGARRAAEALALSVATLSAAWAAWFLGALAYDSWRFNELSVGIIPIPLWIPQAATFAGAALLALALADEFFRVLGGAEPSYRAPEDAIALGKEG
ncbi:MAG: TRAP transporter small permease subunit [Acetobacteraceae bacterium]|nr:TRAP transporter small permease subunit [Acetobacteraceae bacterium]MDW8398759.1 TRAP transporter small permease subunit [Acetobacteraceae bacterium]